MILGVTQLNLQVIDFVRFLVFLTKSKKFIRINDLYFQLRNS
ncbi:hypothetical protein CCP3SC1AL1_50030 [Gammaproteobacteria bacterium]